MARTDFSVDAEGNLSGDGSLHAALRAAGGAGIAAVLPMLVKVFQDLEDAYRKAIANDGRLLGPERPALVALFDLLFEGVLLCWRAAEARTKVDWLYEYEEAAGGLRLAVSGIQESWKVNGRVPGHLLGDRTRLAEGLAGRLRPALQNLLQVLKAILADRKIDAAERDMLGAALGPLLRELFLLRRQVECCLVDD